MAGDGSGGTQVTLVVPPVAGSPGGTSTPPPPPHHPLPFTGFDLAAVVLLGTMLLLLGTVLLTSGRKAAHSRRT